MALLRPQLNLILCFQPTSISCSGSSLFVQACLCISLVVFHLIVSLFVKFVNNKLDFSHWLISNCCPWCSQISTINPFCHVHLCNLVLCLLCLLGVCGTFKMTRQLILCVLLGYEPNSWEQLDVFVAEHHLFCFQDNCSLTKMRVTMAPIFTTG